MTTIEKNVGLDRGARGQGLKERGRLLLPDSKLPHEIAADVGVAWLLAAAAIRANFGRKLDGTVGVETF